MILFNLIVLFFVFFSNYSLSRVKELLDSDKILSKDLDKTLFEKRNKNRDKKNIEFIKNFFKKKDKMENIKKNIKSLL